MASIDCGTFGTSSWQDTDWDTPFQTWVSGPEMSSWIYRKAVGSDAHLVAWLEVRLYAGGAVEFFPWIENGYVRVAGPTSKNGTYRFLVGGAQRFSATINLPSRARTPLMSGATLSHWLGADPAVTPKHDTAYLQATRLVPTYSATVSPTASVLTSLPTTFTPLAQGAFNYSGDNMGGVGYQDPIGLLPLHDVLYLTTTASVAYSGVVRGGMSAGRYPVHYRDETTNRPIRFSQFPTLSTNIGASSTNDYPPSASGTAAPGWDIPHHPSMGYMAYLVTGRWYFMEQVLFVATANFLQQNNLTRQSIAGIFVSSAGANTTRGAAWANRTLAQATTVVPDSDATLRAEFVASLEANINFNHSRYIAQPSHPFGIVQPYGPNGDDYGGPTDGKVTESAWMQDFYTAAFGYMLAMDPPVSAAIKTKLSEFFSWKAKSIVGRLGGTTSDQWLYRDAAVYTLVVAQLDAPDWSGGTGPWPVNMGAMYTATIGSPNTGIVGDLRGGNFPDGTSYWGNLHPAIAYAVEHGVTGASAAYARMTNAPNYRTLLATFNTAPVWSVKPRVP